MGEKKAKNAWKTSYIMVKTNFILSPLSQAQFEWIMWNLDKSLSTEHRLCMQNVKQKEHFLCFSMERGSGQKQAYEGKKSQP